VTSVAERAEAFLARIARYDSAIKAFVTIAPAAARRDAIAADEAFARGESLGPLHGLLVGVKDNIDTAGLRTTAGSRFFADVVPEHDAEVVRRLRKAGAIVLGKTQLHEFAFGATTQNPHHGDCRNPWDAARIPGGSSGGSGAALAAGFCAATLGTDTGGSVRIPAALNGVSGLRPTLGLGSNRGVFPVSWSFDTVGPMARSATDLAPLLAVLAGFDPDDPVSADRPADDYLRELDEGIAGIRVALPRSFYFEEVDAEIVQAVRAAAELLAGLGAVVDEVDLPGAADAFEAGIQIVRTEALAVHRERLDREPELFGEDVRRRLEPAREVSGSDYATHRQTGRVWRQTVGRAFARTDILLTPTTGTTAPLAEDAETIETTLRLARFTYGWAFAGLPALSVPCGFSAEGLPIGLQLAAPRWCEATLLRAGAAYQRETDWHLREPELAHVLEQPLAGRGEVA
jgi:aspartyl-tRNA(Asn)/glutamyl-tRNA(Gln) amidotransferase subunit A